MKSTAGAHRSHSWTVHRLAADFEVIDVWRFEVGSGALGFERFLDAFWAEMQIAEGWALSRLRVAIGKLAGWDKAPNSLPIPGCSESSVAERLSVEEQAKNRVLAGAPSPLPVAAVRAVYRFDDEALYEVSNDTVHALLHLGAVDGGDVELAVYIKSRGAFTRLYMAAIKPFRHLIIYPRLIARVERRLRAAEPSHAAA
jgi:hypothetical protein